MATAQTIIDTALKYLGQLEPNQSANTDESADALVVLNNMLESFNLERLFIYQTIETPYTWAANATSKTIGSGGDISATRPTQILPYTYFRDTRPTPNVDYPLNIINKGEYDSIPIKSIQSTFPQALFYDPGYTLGTIYLWPVPNISIELHVVATSQLTSFSTTGTTVTLPPGYQHLLATNLAVMLAPMYQMEPPSIVVKMAGDAKRNVKRINDPQDIMSLPKPVVQRYSRFNIYTGY